MRNLITFLCVVAIAAFTGNKMNAQDMSSLEGSNYYLIWLDADSEAEYEISGKIVQDLRVNWDGTTNPTGEKAMYIWENTYAANPANGKGSLGQIGGFLDFTAIGGWSGLGFTMRDDSPTRFDVDYTKLTDDYRFHMAVKSNMAKSHMIQVFGSKDGAAKFSVGVGSMESTPNITPNFKSDGSWNIIDIPVSELRTYGFTNRAPFGGNYFVILSGPATNQIAVDAIYFYNPNPAAGVNDVKVGKLDVIVTNQIVEVLNATSPIEVYSVTGSLVKTLNEPIFGVDELAKGVYIVKSGYATAKIMIK